MEVSKKDVLHFNEDLIEFNPDGNMNRLHTLQNHLKQYILETHKKTNDICDVMHAVRNKCYCITDEFNPIYCFPFDNGIEINVDTHGIEAMVHILTDADILKI